MRWVAWAAQLQYELGEGPHLSSLREHGMISSADLQTDQRWPTWSRRMSDELGVRSMLCFQLFTTESSYGALNLYSATVDGFDEQDHTVGLALAAHVAVALASARDLGHKDLAIARRTIMGRAEGILMERFQLQAAQAFAVLRRVSQDTNRKLFDVARDIVDTRGR